MEIRLRFNFGPWGSRDLGARGPSAPKSPIIAITFDQLILAKQHLARWVGMQRFSYDLNLGRGGHVTWGPEGKSSPKSPIAITIERLILTTPNLARRVGIRRSSFDLIFWPCRLRDSGARGQSASKSPIST